MSVGRAGKDVDRELLLAEIGGQVTQLVCLGCGREEELSALESKCACGAHNWLNTSPGQPVDPSVVCFGCGRTGRDPVLGGRCACGARNWIAAAPTPPPAAEAPPGPAAVLETFEELAAEEPVVPELRALGDGAGRLVVDLYPGAAVATVLEGIGQGMVVLLVGAAGVGKSTLAAQAGYVIARQLGARLYWLDADQLRDELIEETFFRARCPPAGLPGRIIPVHVEGDNGLPDFRRALAHVPADQVLVVDSLEAWAPRGDKQALELLRLLRMHPARVKLVVAATNASGGFAGDGELERAGDATVFVERTQIRVGKCRWAIGTKWARRGPAGLEVECLDPEHDVAGPPSTQTSFPAPDLWQASQPRTGGQLSAREHGALTQVLRWWPPTWNFVTAREIVDAVDRDLLEELEDALLDLTGVSELTATNVGNSLRWVKDKPVDGKMLTSKLNRKTKIAQWRVVRVE